MTGLCIFEVVSEFYKNEYDVNSEHEFKQGILRDRGIIHTSNNIQDNVKYLIIANYYNFIKNDTAHAIEYYLLSIELGNALAMNNLGVLYYCNNNFPLAKMYLIMVLTSSLEDIHQIALLNFKRLYRKNNKSIVEYIDALREIPESDLLKNNINSLVLIVEAINKLTETASRLSESGYEDLARPVREAIDGLNKY